MPLPIAILGLGPVGVGIAQELRRRPDSVSLAAAVNPTPEKCGRDLAEILGEGKPLGLIVSAEIGSALSTRGGVAVQATSSHLESVAPQVLDLVSQKWNVLYQ